MVKIKFLLIIFFISLNAAYVYKPSVEAANYWNKNTVIVKDKEPLKQHKTTIVLTVVLGILVFLVSFLTIFVHIKIFKTIKKRQF